MWYKPQHFRSSLSKFCNMFSPESGWYKFFILRQLASSAMFEKSFFPFHAQSANPYRRVVHSFEKMWFPCCKFIITFYYNFIVYYNSHFWISDSVRFTFLPCVIVWAVYLYFIYGCLLSFVFICRRSKHWYLQKNGTGTVNSSSWSFRGENLPAHFFISVLFLLR